MKRGVIIHPIVLHIWAITAVLLAFGVRAAVCHIQHRTSNAEHRSILLMDNHGVLTGCETTTEIGVAFSYLGCSREEAIRQCEADPRNLWHYPFTIELWDHRPGIPEIRATYRVRSRADLLALDGADFTYRGIHWYPVRFEAR